MNTELEEMRQQMAVLKKKLEQQEIINERITSRAKESVEKYMSKINKGYKQGLILAILMIPFFYYVFVYRLAFSIPFGIFSSLWTPFRFFFPLKGLHKFDDKSMQEDSLVVTQKKLIWTKQHYSKWFKYDLMLNIVYPCWLVWEVYQRGLVGELLPLHIGLVVGVLCGFCIFLWAYFHQQRKYQEMLDQIEDLTAE